jgi:hypothetical protein
VRSGEGAPGTVPPVPREWQRAQVSSARFAPREVPSRKRRGLRIFVRSPPEATCSRPGPWQDSHPTPSSVYPERHSPAAGSKDAVKPEAWQPTQRRSADRSRSMEAAAAAAVAKRGVVPAYQVSVSVASQALFAWSHSAGAG